MPVYQPLEHALPSHATSVTGAVPSGVTVKLVASDSSPAWFVAVTSFGYSPNCTGVGGAYRLDQPDDLAFLAGFGITPN